MNPEPIGLTFVEALAQQPPWLLAWLVPLALTNLVALFFVFGRKDGRWILRIEAVAIVVAFLVAGEIMEWIYDQRGYVRLLGAGHLIAWLPTYLWIWTRRNQHPATTLFGKYLILYFVMDGISLVIDFIDLIRYFLDL